MQSLTLHTRVGKDGILKLETPIGIKDTELDIILILNPTTSQKSKGWPPGFFERTFGSIPDFPDRGAQGEFSRIPGLQMEDWQV